MSESKPHITRYDDDGQADPEGDWVHWDDAGRLIEQLEAVQQDHEATTERLRERRDENERLRKAIERELGYTHGADTIDRLKAALSIPASEPPADWDGEAHDAQEWERLHRPACVCGEINTRHCPVHAGGSNQDSGRDS